MANEHGDGPTIFLLEEDDETRALLARNLRSYGYRLIVAPDEENALDRAGDGVRHADLILVNLVGKPVEYALEAGRRIREHAKYDGHTPLVVMPEKYGKDVEGTEVNVEGNDWVFYLSEEPGQLRNLLARLLPWPSDRGSEIRCSTGRAPLFDHLPYRREGRAHHVLTTVKESGRGVH